MNPQINPLAFNYGSDTSLVVPFSKPSSIVVTGRGNRYDGAFQEARKKGGLVYAYANPLSVPDNLNNPQDQEQFLINGQRPPLWKFSGVERSMWPNTKMIDIRSAVWLKKWDQFVRSMIAKKLFDGLFIDTLGARPWAADWENWPVAEQTAYAEACVGIAKLTHDIRAQLQPDFELIHNNIWTLPKTHPAAAIAATGDKYCNGVCLENSPPDANVLKETGKRVRAQFHINYAARQFAGPPFDRRLLVISNRAELFEQWKEDPNVTHIAFVDSANGDDYMKLTPARVPYNDLSRSEQDKQIEELTRAVEALSAENDQLKKSNAAQQIEIASLRELLNKVAPLADQIVQLTNLPSS